MGISEKSILSCYNPGALDLLNVCSNLRTVAQQLKWRGNDPNLGMHTYLAHFAHHVRGVRSRSHYYFRAHYLATLIYAFTSSNTHFTFMVIDKEEETTGKFSIKLFHPIKPMLASRPSTEEVVKIISGPRKYQLETKYDGERVQVHKNGKTIKMYSRYVGVYLVCVRGCVCVVQGSVEIRRLHLNIGSDVRFCACVWCMCMRVCL